MTEDIEIEGYKLCMCNCGRQVLEHVFHLTGGLSFDCFIAQKMVRIHEIEVMNRGKRTPVPIPRTPREIKDKARKVRNREREHQVTRAQQRAMARLKMIYPALFDILYAEERAKIGLPPVPRPGERGAWVRAVETAEAEIV